MSRSRIRPRAFAMLTGALALVFACDSPGIVRNNESHDAAPNVTIPARVRATSRRASGTVDVRLSEFDGAARISIEGSSPATLEIERKGAGVARRNAPEQAEIVLSAAAEQRGLRIGEHTYPGQLRVRARSTGGLEVINVVELEDYVTGVLPAEIVVWSAQPEELRGQAIAARSYAIAALDERGAKSKTPYLVDDARDQAYGGLLDARSAKAREVNTRVAQAVASTRGIVLMEGERVVDARFHAACGGDTAEGRRIFPELEFDCMHSVACAPCRGDLAASRDAGAGASEWSWTAPRATLDALATRWSLGAHIERLAPSATDAAGRWLEVEISGKSGSKRIKFEELRRALGESHIASSRIVRSVPRAGDPIVDGVLFVGRGRGHGVGLCQVGMRDYARAGWTAERILAHYYAGARLVDFR